MIALAVGGLKLSPFSFDLGFSILCSDWNVSGLGLLILVSILALSH